eukprot:m.34917 g.34917  ORF g.34917 m.34917 type:complete len:709 (+) comp9560_c1_seq1:110-2236(+)
MDEEDTTTLINDDDQSISHAKERQGGESGYELDTQSQGQVRVEPAERMGLLGLYPDWLQRFATPVGFLVAVALFTVVQSMVNSGLFPVIISSIERRYGFNSTQSGLILSAYDIVSALLVVVVTNFGHRAHRPVWLARGMICLGVGCFLATIPQWISGVYVFVGNTDADMCLGPNEATCRNAQYGYYVIFIMAQVVIAAGCSPLYPLGSTFIDDNVPPKDNSTYMGIFYSMGAVGPALGFVIGGLFLREWVDAGQTTTLTQSSLAWVGAWWAPFLLAGSLAVLLSLTLAVFPKQLPNTAWILEERRRASDKQAGRKKKKEAAEPSSAPAPHPENASFLTSVKSILNNKPFIFSQLGFTLEAVVIIGVGNFLPKIVQTQFRTTSSNASFYSGAAIVAGAAGGILTGGLISRKWSMKQTTRNVFFLGLAALFTIPCFLIHCDTLSLAGLNSDYPMYTRSFSTTPAPFANTSSLSNQCNMGCDCRGASYKPVCGSGSTYFSACHAGCVQRVGEEAYTNCSCLPSATIVAEDGVCGGSCSRVVYFLLALFLLMFVTFMINVPGTVFCMRVVDEHERSLALGLGSAIQRIGGSIPGPLLIGAILDGSCLLWETKCDGSNGACWEYDSWLMARDVFIASWVLKSCSTISFFIAWRSYRPASPADDLPEDERAKLEASGNSGSHMGDLELSAADSSASLNLNKQGSNGNFKAESMA